MNVLGRFVVVAAFGSLCWIACGGDSEGGDDGVALCKNLCSKYNTCFAADSGFGGLNCDQLCAPSDGGGGGTTCTNQSEISAATKACLDKPCDQFEACFDAIPECKGGTGSGGTGGSGGSTGGTGGSGGSTGGTGGGTGDGGGGTCADLLACCNASTNEMIKMQCLMGYEAVKAQGDAVCGMVLAGIKAGVCP